MKKLLSMLLVVAMVFSLAACGGSSDDKENNTTSEPADTGTENQASEAADESEAVEESEPAEAGGAVQGGTLKVGMSTDATEAAAWRMRSGQEKAVFSAVYEPLMRIDEDGNVVGYLAESLEADEANLTYTVTLRQDVTFSDGSALDADVLLWNFENFKENSQTSATHFGSVESFEKTGDYSVALHLSEWNTQIPFSLNSVAGLMYSKKAFDENGYDWCLEHAVGTGPFKMDSWTKDTKLVFSKNENYWNKDAQPYLDGMEFQVIADEMSAQAAMLNGDIDVYYNGSESFQATMEQAGFSTANNQMWYTILFLIFASDVDGSPLSDVKVRQAISYAIDSQAICDSVGKGKVFVSSQYAVEGTPFYNPDVAGYNYDAEKAKSLLEEAGYGDGFTTTIYCGVDQALTDYLVAIQGYLKEVGITLNIEEQETTIWRSKGIYDIDEGMILAGHGFGANLVNQQVSNFSKRAVDGVGMLKECKLHPDDLDASIMASLSASDTTEMLKNEFETQKLIIDEYCLGYPVGIKYSSAYTLSEKVAENGCFANKNEYNDYSRIGFTE